MLPLYVENNNADTFVIKEKLSKTSNKRHPTRMDILYLVFSSPLHEVFNTTSSHVV